MFLYPPLQRQTYFAPVLLAPKDDLANAWVLPLLA